jgi:AcrR family transcriptional regulator
MGPHMSAISTSTPASQAKQARGRKPIFRREDVIEAALALARRDGYKALSMRAIAAHLGTGIATLYNYFGSQAELNDALALALLREIPLFDAKNARETRRQLKERALAYAGVVARHPDFEQMVGPRADQQIMRLLDSALGAMLNAGVDIERAGIAWSVLQSLAQSHAASSRRLDGVRQGRARQQFQDLAAVRTLAQTGAFRASHEEWFHRVLDSTLDRLLPELKTRPSGR